MGKDFIPNKVSLGVVFFNVFEKFIG